MTVRSDTKRYGVLGWPVAHSLSPRIHHYWYDRLSIDASYAPLPVAPEALSQALRAYVEEGFCGFNITVPHKETILPFMHRLDETAKKIGAVNTVSVQSGELHGFNTDAYGFAENIKRSIRNEFSSPVAVMLGAGGAARAVCVALHDVLGFKEIRVINRSRTRAETLIQSLDVFAKIYEWNEAEAALHGASFLVNTTSLGMEGEPELAMDLSPLLPGAVVTDIVYKPRKTLLLRQAESKGLEAIGGLGMLVHQAAKAFELWFGVSPPIDDALYAMLDAA